MLDNETKDIVEIISTYGVDWNVSATIVSTPWDDTNYTLSRVCRTMAISKGSYNNLRTSYLLDCKRNGIKSTNKDIYLTKLRLDKPCPYIHDKNYIIVADIINPPVIEIEGIKYNVSLFVPRADLIEYIPSEIIHKKTTHKKDSDEFKYNFSAFIGGITRIKPGESPEDAYLWDMFTSKPVPCKLKMKYTITEADWMDAFKKANEEYFESIKESDKNA